LSKPNAKVQIVGLQSEQGKSINSRIGTIKGKRNPKTGRFPVEVVHKITGESKVQGIKPRNLNIYPPKALLSIEEKQLQNLRYSNDAKVRMQHGMILDECLMMSRFHSNMISGFAYFENDYNKFLRLPKQHPAVYQCSSSMWTFWNVRPSQAGRCGNLSVLDMSVTGLIQNEDQIVKRIGTKTDWHADGPKGDYLVRNYVRFMRSWETERINGQFWVTAVEKTGTLMVKTNEDGELGDVYLVKGLNQVIGELFANRLPALCHATILPIYDLLVYDGILIGVPPSRLQHQMMNNNQPISYTYNAVADGAVITQGESSKKGLWDAPPPPLPRIVKEGEPLDWYVHDNNILSPSDEEEIKSNNDNKKGGSIVKDGKNNTTQEKELEITDKQQKLGMRLAKLVKKKGGIKGKLFDGSSSSSSEERHFFVFRRFGYTRKDNPEQMCAVLHNGAPVRMFYFNDELTYNLDEVLREIIVVMKDTNMPPIIMIDELSVVEPLRKVLGECFEAVGITDSFRIEWYPPPSEEERRFNEMTSPF